MRVRLGSPGNTRIKFCLRFTYCVTIYQDFKFVPSASSLLAPTSWTVSRLNNWNGPALDGFRSFHKNSWNRHEMARPLDPVMEL